MFSLSVIGCASSSSYDNLYGASTSNPPYLQKLLVLPVDITIEERFPGNIFEDIPPWTRMANKTVAEEFTTIFKSELKGQAILYSEIKDASAIDPYLPLIRNVSQAVRIHTRGFDLWPWKMAHFDYTIGNGLTALRHNGVDAVLYISGYQSVEAFRPDSSKESVYTYRKADLSLGDLYIALTLIDTASGELLWNYAGTFSNIDLRDNSEVRETLFQALTKFPRQILKG